MIRLVLIASLLVGCRTSLETEDTGASTCEVSTTSPSCLDAVTHSDLKWIGANIFVASCNFTGCHSSANDAGQLDLHPLVSHNALVNVKSKIDPTRTLVVPGDPASSYLMLMLRAFPPEMATPPGVAPPAAIGFMPEFAPTLCCQKLDAVESWIMGGALDN